MKWRAGCKQRWYFYPQKLLKVVALWPGVCMHLDHSAPALPTLKGTASDICVPCASKMSFAVFF